jgi:hypothetical protein
MMFRPTIAALLATGLLFVAPIAHAQNVVTPPLPGVFAGQMLVTGSSWSLSNNLQDLSGPWASVTVTNTNCTTPFRPGTAQAGAVIFTAQLIPGFPSNATLRPFIGSAASGQVTLEPLADAGGTNVTASLNGLEPFVVGTTLSVCLTQGPPPPMLADINVGEQHVAANNFDVTGVATATNMDQPLIAITGTQTTADGINRQWAFFFVGDVFLGTDTFIPSLAPLQLMGSPGPDQIDISYEDPAGGPPVTITYTLAGGVLTPNGTPPGH